MGPPQKWEKKWDSRWSISCVALHPNVHRFHPLVGDEPRKNRTELCWLIFVGGWFSLSLKEILKLTGIWNGKHIHIIYSYVNAYLHTHTATIKSTRISCLEIHGALVFSIYTLLRCWSWMTLVAWTSAATRQRGDLSLRLVVVVIVEMGKLEWPSNLSKSSSCCFFFGGGG